MSLLNPFPVYGVIQDSTGTPIVGAIVEARDLTSYIGTGTTTTIADGYYQIDIQYVASADGNTIEITCTHNSESNSDSFTLDVSGGFEEVDLQLQKLYEASTIATAGIDWDSLEQVYSGEKIIRDKNGDLHAIWKTSTDYIMHANSTNSGDSWETATTVSPDGDGHTPTMAVDNLGYVHVVWLQFEGSENHLLYRRNTGSWESISTLKADVVAFPAIKADAFNNLHVAWAKFSPAVSRDFGYKKYHVAGSSWGAEETIASSPYIPYWCHLFIDNNQDVYVITSERTSVTLENQTNVHKRVAESNWVGKFLILDGDSHLKHSENMVFALSEENISPNLLFI